MQVMFSATENNDEELTNQVANDVESAQENGVVDTDEVTYVNLGSGKVLVSDKENGEATVIEQDPEDAESYSLEGIENDEQLEQYLHMLEDGVTPDEGVMTEPTEDVWEDHMNGEEVISPNLPDGGLNPQAGYEPSVEELYEEDEDDDEEEKEFSVASDNSVVLRIFSDSEYYDRLFSQVLDEDKPAFIGDLKIEKCDDDTVVVTDVESGDEAQITLDDEDMIVTEGQKEFEEGEKSYSVNMTEDELVLFSDILDDYYYGDEDEYLFSDDDDDYEDEYLFSDDEEDYLDEYLFSDDEEDEDENDDDEDDYDEDDEDDYDDEDEDEDNGPEQYEPVYVVGLDPVDHVLVDSPVYGEEDANELAQRLSEDGVEGVNIFDDPDDAREYAIGLLGEAGVSEVEQVAEPEEREYSDFTVYTTRFFSDYDECTDYMLRLFSESEDGDSTSQDEIEEAIESGEQVENDDEIITPIDDETAIVEDKENGEFTKVTLDGDDMDVEEISEDEADDLLDEKDAIEENEKKFSSLIKFFDEIVPQQEVQGQPIEQPMQQVDPSQINPETGDPMMQEEEMPQQGVEGIEDKALAAVQSIQEAANNAVLAIQEAKEAPAPGEEQDLREAHFSEIYDDYDYEDCGYMSDDTLVNWLTNM